VGAPAPAPVEPRRELVAKDIAYPSTLTDEDISYLHDLYADDMAVFGALSGLDVRTWGKGRPTEKRAKVLDGLRLDGLGLEVGAGYGPLAAGQPDLNCRSLDHLDQAGLQARFADTDNDMSLVPPVDYVWNGERYLDLVGETRFDWIVASHVIEHVPDMIGFINECADILAEGGVLSLVVPDKRRTFDIYRPLTGLGGLIDAHLQGRRLSSPGLTAEFAFNLAKLDGRDIWTENDSGAPEFELDEWWAKHEMEKAVSGAYIDIHAWVFTPSSFRLLIEDLNALGFIGLREARFEAGGEHEFFIQLSLNGQGPDVGRETLSRRTLLEQPEAIVADLPLEALPLVSSLEAENAALKRSLDEIRGSTLWKLGAPLRQLGRMRAGRRS
jgi:SAM-dependent methyltransferase